MAELNALPKLHVTFVCTGNICRSLIAEKVLAHQLAERGLAGRVRVTSAGTGGWHAGQPADERATSVLAEFGYPTAHHAAQFGDNHLSADLIIALADDHYRSVVHVGADPERVRLLRSFDPQASRAAMDVEDPYYGDRKDFLKVLTVVEAAMPGVHDWVDKVLTERETR